MLAAPPSPPFLLWPEGWRKGCLAVCERFLQLQQVEHNYNIKIILKLWSAASVWSPGDVHINVHSHLRMNRVELETRLFVPWSQSFQGFQICPLSSWSQFVLTLILIALWKRSDRFGANRINSLDLGGQSWRSKLTANSWHYSGFFCFSAHFLLTKYHKNGFKHCGVTQNLKRGMNLHFI